MPAWWTKVFVFQTQQKFTSHLWLVVIKFISFPKLTGSYHLLFTTCFLRQKKLPQWCKDVNTGCPWMIGTMFEKNIKNKKPRVILILILCNILVDMSVTFSNCSNVLWHNWKPVKKPDISRSGPTPQWSYSKLLPRHHYCVTQPEQ